MSSTDTDIQTVIAHCWDLCDEGWTFSFTADQWWTLTATCPHGTFTEWSRSHFDLHATLGRLLSGIILTHPDNNSARDGLYDIIYSYPSLQRIDPTEIDALVLDLLAHQSQTNPPTEGES